MSKLLVSAVIFVAVLLGVGYGLTKGSVALPSLHSNSYTYTDYATEWRDEAKTLKWPQGVSAPSPPDQAHAAFGGPGAGEVDVELRWECYWTRDWLVSYGQDKQQAQRAIAMLETVRDKPLWSAIDFQQQLNKKYAEMKRGIPTEATTDVRAGCPIGSVG